MGDGRLLLDSRQILTSVLIVLATLGSGCGKETKVTRVDTGLVTDLSGRWNDTDSEQVAETMVKEALSYPSFPKYVKAKGHQPIVVVGTVVNRSHEHINTQTFITDLERELTNSQKVLLSLRVRQNAKSSGTNGASRLSMRARIPKSRPAKRWARIT